MSAATVFVKPVKYMNKRIFHPINCLLLLMTVLWMVYHPVLRAEGIPDRSRISLFLGDRVSCLLDKAEAGEKGGEWTSALRLYGEAIQTGHEVLKCRIDRLGDSHMDVATGLDGLADLYLIRRQLLEKMGREEEKEGRELCDFVLIYERAEWIRTQAYGTPFHPDIALTLDREALLWQHCHPPQAEKFYKAAVSCRENIFGPTREEVAGACDRYAAYLQYCTMKFKAARAQYERALSIRETLFGKDHPLTVETLTNLAWSAYYSGDKDFAKSIVHHAVNRIQKQTIPNRLDMADALNSLALFLDETGDHDKALVLLQKTVDIRKTVLSPLNPEVAYTLVDLARVNLNQNHPEQALVTYEEALAILGTAYGPEHPELESVILEMIGIMEEKGNRDRVKKLHDRYDRIQKKKRT